MRKVRDSAGSKYSSSSTPTAPVVQPKRTSFAIQPTTTSSATSIQSSYDQEELQRYKKMSESTTGNDIRQQRLEQERLERQREEQRTSSKAESYVPVPHSVPSTDLRQQRLEQERLERQREEQRRVDVYAAPSTDIRQQRLEQERLERQREEQRLMQQKENEKKSAQEAFRLQQQFSSLGTTSEPDPTVPALVARPVPTPGVIQPTPTVAPVQVPTRAQVQPALKAQVLYAYEAMEENEISLVEGETLSDINQVDDGWWSGTNSAGKTGLFPANYVQMVAATSVAATVAPVPAPVQEKRVKAQYDYEAAEENELSFAENDIIENVDFVTEDWYRGTLNGKTGLFPSNYVELL